VVLLTRLPADHPSWLHGWVELSKLRFGKPASEEFVMEYTTVPRLFMEYGSCHDFLHSEPDISNTESNFVKYNYSLGSSLFWFGIWRSAYLVHSEAHDPPCP